MDQASLDRLIIAVPVGTAEMERSISVYLDDIGSLHKLNDCVNMLHCVLLVFTYNHKYYYAMYPNLKAHLHFWKKHSKIQKNSKFILNVYFHHL